MVELDYIRKRTEAVKDYLEEIKIKAPSFIERYNSYILDEEVITKIKCHSDKVLILAFSAEWCPDCSRNIPILAQIERETGIEVRIFGHIIRDAKSSTEKWRIPPSPPEVKDFNIMKIPTIIVINQQGDIMGKIVENPPESKTLESAILDILES